MAKVYIKQNRYGKELVKFMKKVIDKKDSQKHTAYEYTVRILLKGDFEESYTKEDNASVIPTDTMKNSVYALAKTHDFTEPEVFAGIVANHFTSLDKFNHVSSAECSVVQHRWTRIALSSGESHAHSFVKDGEDLRTAVCVATRNGSLSMISGLKDLLVLKTTGSAFYGFFKDEWTTLPEVYDRIFSTAVDCVYSWATFPSVDKVVASSTKFAEAFSGVRRITLDIFAQDDSCSVQATMYKMCEKFINEYSGVAEVEYTLPNKHYFEAQLAPLGLDNHGETATIYLPQSGPSGHINACIARVEEAVI